MPDSTSPLNRTLLALWGMARPLILLSVLLVYTLGCAIARSQGLPGSAASIIWGGVALLFVSLSIHYVNEYADYETDALTHKTEFSGGSGILPSGLVSPRLALQAAWGTLLVGIGVALIAVLLRILDALILPILLFGAWGGWMYSMPPLKLAWNGWGEVTNAFLGGMLLTLYGYIVCTRQFDGRVLLITLPFALVDFLNLLATTWADVAADTEVGKRTLATRLSIPTLRRSYAVVAVIVVVLIMLLPREVLPERVALASLAVVPFLVWGWLRYTRTASPTPSVIAMVALLIVQMLAYFSL